MRRALFLDCDDCLYQNGWRTEARITASIGEYLEAHVGVPASKAFELYKAYGSTLKGLLAEGTLDTSGAEEFLIAAHDIDYCDIRPDPQLAAQLERLRVTTCVFTAGTHEHAKRCMHALGLGDRLRLQGIVDVRACNFETKHSSSSFEAALARARACDPSLSHEDCILCDDSERNIQRAKAMGWTTVLVGPARGSTGQPRACEAADYIIPSLHVLPTVLPDLFAPRRPILEAAMALNSSPSATLSSQKRPRSLEEEIDVSLLPRRVSCEL